MESDGTSHYLSQWGYFFIKYSFLYIFAKLKVRSISKSTLGKIVTWNLTIINNTKDT